MSDINSAAQKAKIQARIAKVVYRKLVIFRAFRLRRLLVWLEALEKVS